MLENERNLLDAVWKLNDKVDTLLTDVSELKTDMVEVKADVAELKADMVEVKADVAGLKTDMVEVKADVAVLKTDMVGVKQDITRLESLEAEVKSLHFDVVELRMICENDLNKQIRIIAETHGDLIRYFRKALERKAEMEEYSIRVLYLEGEVRRIKRYLDLELSA